MNCKNCGAPLRPKAKFCGVCGTPVTASKEEVSPKQEAYRPASRERESSPKQEAYRPPVKKKSDPDSEISTSEMKTIRKYFLSQTIIPLVLIIIGIPLLFAMGIGLIFIIIGLVKLFQTSYKGEDVVDQATKRQIHILKKRGLEKLNLIQEQISLIDPVIIIGVGDSPDSSFDAARMSSQMVKKKRFSLFHIFSLFGKKKKDGTENDPIEAFRIGSDEALRSMLIEVSVYVFTEQQILLYKGDVDISTGLVYKELTAECFYQDIEGMNFSQYVYKVFNQKKKEYTNKIMESFVLFLGGCKFSASINTEMNHSGLENQFTAMRNLIRDKKNR